ncbi:hypothetical protein [Dactylosporangium sp. CA-139066]|uniref:hypothetical protein n=1 Tax=Dactylosporangium sp. CA-139066 TaxID=3239930 RepID=UPI003D94D9E0
MIGVVAEECATDRRKKRGGLDLRYPPGVLFGHGFTDLAGETKCRSANRRRLCQLAFRHPAGVDHFSGSGRKYRGLWVTGNNFVHLGNRSVASTADSWNAALIGFLAH